VDPSALLHSLARDEVSHACKRGSPCPTRRRSLGSSQRIIFGSRKIVARAGGGSSPALNQHIIPSFRRLHAGVSASEGCEVGDTARRKSIRRRGGGEYVAPSATLDRISICAGTALAAVNKKANPLIDSHPTENGALRSQLDARIL